MKASELLLPNVKCNLPPCITDHKMIRDDINLWKIFPDIGLPNSSKAIKLDLDCSKIDIAKTLVLAIRKYLTEFKENYCLADFKKAELFRLTTIIYILEELSKILPNGLVDGKLLKKGENIYLATPILSFDGSALIKTGTDVFKLTQKIFDIGRKYVQINLTHTKDIQKELSNTRIVFSSDGVEGAQDIATMSMRGIKSCMRWGARESTALVGSLLDPCCGIIYLTNDSKTEYGSKMLFRSVVRLGIHAATNEPIIIVDRVYSCFYKTRPGEVTQIDKSIADFFVDYISQTINKKIKVIHTLDKKQLSKIIYNITLPLPPQLQYIRDGEWSYRDTLFSYAPFSIECYLDNIKKFNSKPKKTVKRTTAKSKSKKVKIQNVSPM